MRLAILYEHPEWFLPLFDTLRRRGIPHERIHAAALQWDPVAPPPFTLLLNRMSPSAYLRGHEHAIHATAAFLHHVESWEVPVVNGLATYRLETSKAAQLDLFRRLAVPHPRARVINHPAQAVPAARRLHFPIVVKPNVGGSGARIVRFDSQDALDTAAREGRLDLGIDRTALVQECVPARDGSFTRIELLDHELLYAIRITPPPGHGFNLCPADICQDDGQAGAATARDDPAVDGVCANKPAMHIERVDLPHDVLAMATVLAREGGLDICGVEYLMDDRDGRPYFYDVNALSNFVTDAVRIVGFDPFERFADYLEARLRRSDSKVSPAPVPVGSASRLHGSPERQTAR